MSTRPFARAFFLIAAPALLVMTACQKSSPSPYEVQADTTGYSITVAPTDADIFVGQSQLFVATGSPKIDMTTLSWFLDVNGIATLSPPILPSDPHGTSNATVTCNTPGTVGVFARFTVTKSSVIIIDGKSLLHCNPRPAVAKVDTPKVKLGSAATQLTARDAAGNALTSGVTWTATNPSVLSVTASGLATAKSPGTSLLTATNAGGSAQALGYVLGDGACTLNPGTGGRFVTFTVQSDPGAHATEIGVPSTAIVVNFSFVTFEGGPYAIITGPAPISRLDGGFVAPTNCAFVTNGTGTFAGKSNVGVRLEGTWTNGTMTMKFTVGTNGELSGGATVYTATAN